MATVISFANQKGGVAKTTSCVNIGSGLAVRGFKTLLIDFDPQASLTRFFGSPDSHSNYIGDWVLERCEFSNVLKATPFKNLEFIPSNEKLKVDEMDMQTDILNATDFLFSKVSRLNGYDFILIDTLPSLSLLSLNCLMASQYAVIPTKLDYLSIDGLSQLIKQIGKVQKKNPIAILGIVATFYRKGINEQEKCLAELRKMFPEKLFSAVIRLNTKLDESAREGTPAIHYAPESAGAQDYSALCEEILTRCQMEKQPNPVA